MAVDVIATAAPKVASTEVTPAFKHGVIGVIALLTAFMVAKKLKR